MDKQVLSAIEKELLEHARKGQPVLLYGNDPYRIYLVGKIQVIRKTLQLKKDITESTWGYLDCKKKDGKEILQILSHPRKYDYVKGVMTKKEGFYYRSIEGVMPIPGTFKQWNKTIDSSGLLFLDNLHCDSKDSKDINNYERLASVIEEIRRRPPILRDWLVAYARNPDNFPDYFIEQYKQISLDTEKPEIETSEVEESDTLRYDSRLSFLYILGEDDKHVYIEPQEHKLLAYMNKKPHFRLEEILKVVFGRREVQFDKTIKKEDRGVFDKTKSEINKKCREELGIEYLIENVQGISRIFKLSQKITFL